MVLDQLGCLHLSFLHCLCDKLSVTQWPQQQHGYIYEYKHNGISIIVVDELFV